MWNVKVNVIHVMDGDAVGMFVVMVATSKRIGINTFVIMSEITFELVHQTLQTCCPLQSRHPHFHCPSAS
jgi:hypothetical protein